MPTKPRAMLQIKQQQQQKGRNTESMSYATSSVERKNQHKGINNAVDASSNSRP